MKKIFLLLSLMITGLSFGQTYSNGTQVGEIIKPPDPGASKFVRLKIQNLHSTGYAGLVLISNTDTVFLQVDQAGKLTISSFTTNAITANTTISALGDVTLKGKLYVVRDGDTTIIDPNSNLYTFDLRVNSLRKFAVDSTGKVTTAGTINGLTVSNAIPALVTTATASSDTTSSGAKLSAVTQFVTITSSGATNKLMLPATSSSTVGLIINGFVGANGCKLRVAASQSGTVYLNNTVTNKQATIGANVLFKATCVSSTQWVLTATDYAGAAVATITPASY
jgi:hypothetical protein